MIHFHLVDSINYYSVQEQILSTIKKHLPNDKWTESQEYKSGSLNFSLFIDLKAEVLMSHGVADKNYHFRKERFNSDLSINNSRSRQHIIVPGNFIKNRILQSKELNFSDNQIHIGGWPRLDYLLAESKKIKTKSDTKTPNILWAPTHNFIKGKPSKRAMSSYPEFEKYAIKLSKAYDVEVSLHPRNRTQKKPTDIALIESDIVISDFGTIVYEAIALGKHVIFPSWLIKEEIIKRMDPDSAEYKIFNERIGMHATSYQHMLELIEKCKEPNINTHPFFDNFYSSEFHKKGGSEVAKILLKLDKKFVFNTPKLSSLKSLEKKGLRTNNALDTRGKTIKITFEPPVQLNNAQLFCYNDFKIGMYSFLRTGTVRYVNQIGRYVSIGPNVILGEVEHPTSWLSTSPAQYNSKQFSFYPAENISAKERTISRKKSNDNSPKGLITIGNDVWVGAGAIIRRGIKVGDGSIIAGGAFVTKNVEPYSIVAGVPAKHVKYRFSEKIISKLLILKWWEFDINDLKGVHFDDIENAMLQIKNLEKKGAIKRKLKKYRQITIIATSKVKGASDFT